MIKICIVYTHHKLGDLIWQLPYMKAISSHHGTKVDLILRKKTQAKNILSDMSYINEIHYNEFRKGLNYWIDVFKLFKIFSKNKYDYVYILDKVNKPAIAAKFAGINDPITIIRSKTFQPSEKKSLTVFSPKNLIIISIRNIAVIAASAKISKLNNAGFKV